MTAYKQGEHMPNPFKPKPPTDEPLEFVPALAKVVSLATLATELGVPVDALASELGEAVTVEPQTLLRVVDVPTSHRVIELHHEGARRRAEAARLNEARLLAAQRPPTRYARDRHLEELAAHGFESGGQR
jgi:hypothetical protein